MRNDFETSGKVLNNVVETDSSQDWSIDWSIGGAQQLPFHKHTKTNLNNWAH